MICGEKTTTQQAIEIELKKTLVLFPRTWAEIENVPYQLDASGVGKRDHFETRRRIQLEKFNYDRGKDKELL